MTDYCIHEFYPHRIEGGIYVMQCACGEREDDA